MYEYDIISKNNKIGVFKVEQSKRFENTKKASLIGIFANIFLLIIKGIIGVLTKSQSMIADSINSASDIFASFMTFLGNKIASEPSDESHNFGHGKAEYLFSMFISIAMIFLAIKLLTDSIIALYNGSHLIFSWGLIIVCIITILVKFSLYIYVRSLNKKNNNILLEANYKDHRNDCIVTTGTLISSIFALYGVFWVDSVIGIFISLWILYTGVKIFIESYNILMDKSVDEDIKDNILDIAHTYKEIKSISDFYSSPSGYKYNIFLTIYIDGNMSTFESHDIADSLENDIKKLERINNVIIHVNPV